MQSLKRHPLSTVQRAADERWVSYLQSRITVDERAYKHGQFVGGAKFQTGFLVVSTALPFAELGEAGSAASATTSTGRIFSAQDDIGKIISSGRIWGQTEGSVYGMRIQNASNLRTLGQVGPFTDRGLVIFEERAANLFERHPINGPWSLTKRLLGQQKAGFGDIIFDPAQVSVSADGKTLIVRGAYLGRHAGQSELQALVRYYASKTIDRAAVPSAAWLFYEAHKKER